MASSSAEDRRTRLQGMVVGLRRKFSTVPQITVREANSALHSSGSPAVVLVDTRTPDEVAVSRLPNAFTAEQFEGRKEEFQEALIVAYCTIGYRSCQYAEKLRGRGFDARNLEGSILAWTQEGLPLVTGAGSEERPTTKVHVFGKQWELQGEGYEAVMFDWPMLSLASASAKEAWTGWRGGRNK